MFVFKTSYGSEHLEYKIKGLLEHILPMVYILSDLFICRVFLNYLTCFNLAVSTLVFLYKDHIKYILIYKDCIFLVWFGLACHLPILPANHMDTFSRSQLCFH